MWHILVMIWSLCLVLCLVLKSLCRLSPCDCLPCPWLFPSVIAGPALIVFTCVSFPVVQSPPPACVCKPCSSHYLRIENAGRLCFPVWLRTVWSAFLSSCLVCWNKYCFLLKLCRHLGPLSLWHLMTILFSNCYCALELEVCLTFDSIVSLQQYYTNLHPECQRSGLGQHV